MIAHALRRLLGMVFTLAVSSLLIFGAMYAAPGDPVSFLVGDPENVTPERVAAVRAAYHLDEPLIVQYGLWAAGAVTGDLGTSFQYNSAVGDLILTRLPATLALVGYACVLFTVFGVALGALAAVRRGGRTDSAVTAGTTLAASIPSFVLAIALISLFGVQLGWFPVAGLGEGLLGRLHHLTLPAIALSLGSLAIVARVTRQTMAEQLDLEHVTAARASGIGEGHVVRRHVLRNALGPVVTMCGLVTASMLGGTVAIETVFGISGIGSLLVGAINTFDFPVVQAVLLYMVIAYMVVTTLIDLVHPLLDPRVRAQGSRA
ncbi:ABC transporter permease [Nocardiopsis aegyptia]|uniref:Peptide/nickel transport system permease protein n=1 Tax=Nocardiopsis aegyptia TaxID=220378 RepID=A0A7Z0EVE6_9ACTN|nr:ABC transporter permease [Nocardiopsis aegyptia]NYJ38008.1 peptide/nickel transport system permease protein [Nocardiopsis aegyptia]